MQSVKPKCEDIGFVHAWEHPPGMISIAPGLFAPNERVRVCRNCGRQQVHAYRGTTHLSPDQPVAVFEWRDAE